MLARALTLAARRGVDVRLIVPDALQPHLADLARAGYIRDLHTAGGQGPALHPVMLHAKAVVFDDSLAVIGSANMDMRSLFLNFEMALYVYDLQHTSTRRRLGGRTDGRLQARAANARTGNARSPRTSSDSCHRCCSD